MRKPNGLFSAVVLAAVLAVGFATVWGVLLKWAYETVRSFRAPIVEEALLVRADGTPVVERWCFVNDKPLVPPQEKFRDLAGNPVQVPDDAPWAAGVVLWGGLREGVLADWLSPQESWDYRQLRVHTSQDAVAWYFLSDGWRHGSAYFVAYDTQEAQRVGYLGTAGFRTTPLPPEECFPFDGSNRGTHFQILNSRSYGRFLPLDRLAKQSRLMEPIYLWADNDKVYQVDLATRNVQVAFEGQPIRSAGLMTCSAPAPDAGRTFLVVCTGDAVLKLDGSNRVVRRFPLPEDLRNRGFSWHETASGEVVTSANLDHDPESGKARFQLLWFDAGDRLVRREETWIQWPIRGEMRFFVTGALSPAIADWLLIDPLMLAYVPSWSGYLKVLGNRLVEDWPVFVLLHIVAAGFAWLCHRRLVHYGATRAERVIWPLFVFFLGLPGWVGFRFARHWPVREACPSCGAVVPRDRLPCAGCGADFPAPAPNGTEVFAK